MIAASVCETESQNVVHLFLDEFPDTVGGRYRSINRTGKWVDVQPYEIRDDMGLLVDTEKGVIL
jgi:hypothetical protein